MNKLRTNSLFLRTVLLFVFLVIFNITFIFADNNNCTISSNQTYGQSDINTCAGGTVDNLTVNEGVTLTLTEAISVVSTVTVNGTINHAAEDADGVNITAANITIGTNGAINVDDRGCSGVAAGNGKGPDTNSASGTYKVCTQSLGGYGAYSDNGGAGGGYGGAGGHGGSSAGSGGVVYGNSLSPEFLGSAGGGSISSSAGASGGGLIRLVVSGTLTINGYISADGANGGTSGRATGGGSGGGIYIDTNTLTGSASATITANGGNGGDTAFYDGGSGAGGRIAVYYATITTFDVANIQANKGTIGGAGSSTVGGLGTTFILDEGIDELRINSGLDFRSDGDYARNSIRINPSANLYCNTSSSITTLTVSSIQNITDNGAIWNCTATITTLNISAGNTLSTTNINWDFTNTSNWNLSAATWTSSGTNTIDVTKSGALMDFDIDNNLTLNGLTFTGTDAGTSSANGGVITFDNPISVSLVNTDINASVDWDNLTALSIDSSSSIAANAKGCSYTTDDGGKGPVTDSGSGTYKVCTQDTSGFGEYASNGGGGGGYGGSGGRGSSANTGGTTYGLNTNPIFFGSSGGGSIGGGKGGYGGGVVLIDINGDLTLSGIISANGQNGPNAGRAGGGGSGGSINLDILGDINGTGTITANGGNGGDTTFYDGGGGGGGRIAVYYVNDNNNLLATNLSVTGGTSGGAGSAAAGSTGTTYTDTYSAPNTPSISSPSEAATGVSRGPTVTSSAYSSDGQSHTVSDWQISDNNTFSDSDCTDTNIVYCAMDSSNLESIVVNSSNGTFQNALSGKTKLAPSTTYYVRVRHANGLGDSTWSTAVSFTTTTNTVPSTPTNSSPANVATSVSLNPTLTASAFSDSDSDTHYSTDWVVYPSSDCTGTPAWSKDNSTSNLTSIVVNSTNGTFASGTALSAHTTYSFKVLYTDSYSGDSSYSGCTNFSTANTVPTISVLSSPTQGTDGTGMISFTVTAGDSDSDATKLKVEYSEDGGSTWYDPFLVSVSPSSGTVDIDNNQTYQIGTSNNIDSSSGSINLQIVWDTMNVSNGNGAIITEQDDIKLRFTVNDLIADGTAVLSSAFSIDDSAPQGMSNFTVSSDTSSTISLSWTAASSEGNFDNYEICYDTLEADVTSTCGSGNLWDQSDSSSLSTMSTSSVTITGLNEDNTYYLMLIAVDDYGNKATSSVIAHNNNGIPIVSGLSATQDVNANHEVTLIFTANDSDLDNDIKASVQYYNGSSWNLATLTSVSQSNPATPDAEPVIDNGETYNIGTSDGYIHSSEGANTITAVWDIDSDLTDVDSDDIQVRVKLNDGTEDGSYSTSSSFTVDQVSPSGPGSISFGSYTSTSILLNWSEVNERNFASYKIYYGTNPANVNNETSSVWNSSNDTALTTKPTTSTTVTGLTENTTYYFKVKALDDYGNGSMTSIANQKTNEKPVIEILSVEMSTDGSGDLELNFALTDGDNNDIKVKSLYNQGSTPQDMTFSDAISGTSQSGDIIVDNSNSYQLGTSSGYIDSSPEENIISSIWQSATDLPNIEDDNFVICLTANDQIEDGSEVCSEEFVVDNKDPEGLADLQITETSGLNTITVSWTAVSGEDNFEEYRLVYGIDEEDVSNEDGDSVVLDASTDSSLGTMSTNTLSVSGLSLATTYYIELKAADAYGNISDILTGTFSIEENNNGGGSSAKSLSSFTYKTTDSKSDKNEESKTNEKVETEDSQDDEIKEVVDFDEKDNEVDALEKVLENLEDEVSIADAEDFIANELDTHWSQPYYEKLLILQNQLSSSDSEEDYIPKELLNVDEELSRLEMIVLLGDIMGVTLSSEISEDPFTDFKKDDKYAEYLDYFKKVGVIKGYSDGSFKPNSKINRVETLKLVFKALDISVKELYGKDLENEYELLNPFEDVDLNAWYAPYVIFAYDKTIVNGYGNKLFKPANTITSGQLTKIIVLSMEISE